MKAAVFTCDYSTALARSLIRLLESDNRVQLLKYGYDVPESNNRRFGIVFIAPKDVETFITLRYGCKLEYIEDE